MVPLREESERSLRVKSQQLRGRNQLAFLEQQEVPWCPPRTRWLMEHNHQRPEISEINRNKEGKCD